MKVLFCGEGGQGVQVIAEILAKAAFSENKHALYIPNFGVEQRGGVSLAFVTIDSRPVAYPKFKKAEILAILTDRANDRVRPYIDKQTKIILGPAVKGGLKTTLPPKAWNILVLGQVNKMAKIVSPASLARAMEERFAKQFEKNLQLRKLDLEALKG